MGFGGNCAVVILWESFLLACGSFGPEIFVSEFFRRQSPGFLALQVEGLLAHIITVLVTYHTYIIKMMATTLSTMMGNDGVADALTAPPPTPQRPRL
jgi:hypothetical protein